MMLKKIITDSGKVIHFGVKTPKGNVYFGDDVENLTKFMRQRSADVAKIDGDLCVIHSIESPGYGNFDFYLDDGRVLKVRREVDAHGKTHNIATFDVDWK